jgi:hypothetical protein
MKRIIKVVVIMSSLIGLAGFWLTGCGDGISSRSNGHAPVCADLTLTDHLLQAPNLDVNCISPPVFHPILSGENYEAILKLNDLSYAVANEFGYSLHQRYPTDREIGPLRDRIRAISAWLTERGWGQYQRINGNTGRDNVDPDITAIINTKPMQRLIVVSFHGSRIGDRNPHNHNGRGDWGANYDTQPVVPSTIGLPEFPDHVRIHRGYGNNLASARVELLEELDRQVDALGNGAPIWVLVTGHSKGGGMAGLAAGMFKSHFLVESAQFSHVKVGGLLFSSPRVYHGDVSEDWVHAVVGRSNLFRINVHGDPVTVNPSRDEGYRSIGVLFLDYIWAVNLRNRQNYGQETNTWLAPSEWSNFHYGSGGRGLGYEFDPAVVMRYVDLPGGFEEGRLHLRSRR